MKKSKGLGFILALLVAMIFLTVNVFAEEGSNFYSYILSNEVVLDEESSIFDLTVHITQKAGKIMDGATDRDELTQLLYGLIDEYDLRDHLDIEELLETYKDYEKYYKNKFEKGSRAYTGYIKEEKALKEIYDAINSAITNQVEAAIKHKKTDSETVNSINQILDKYRLMRDLDAKEVLTDYYQNKEDIEELERKVFRLYEKYEFEKWVHYNIVSFVNKTKDLESDDDKLNEIYELHRKLGISYSSPIELQNTYKSVIDYDFENQVEALSKYAINTINDNNIKNRINDLYEDIRYAIYGLREDAIYEELYTLLKKYDVDSLVAEGRLMNLYEDYEEYGYESGEAAVLHESLKGLDLRYSGEVINKLIDRIIELMDANENSSNLVSSLDPDIYEDLSEDFGDEICRTFKNYDIDETFDFSKILGVYSNYKANVYDDYEEPLIIEITEMLKNTKLHERIIDTINEMDETDNEEEVVEEISKQLGYKSLEKYADHAAIKEVIKNDNLDNDNRAKEIADIIIAVIVNSEKGDILDVFEELIEEISLDQKYRPIFNVLEEYKLREYVHPQEVIEVFHNYKRLDYSSEKEALYEKIFKYYTKAFSDEDKNNLKEEIIRVLKKKDSEGIDYEEYIYSIYKKLKRHNLGGYVKSDDLLNIFYEYESHGYTNQKEGMINELVKGIVKKVEVEIIEVMDSDKDEVAIKRSISRILKSNDLQYKIDAEKIIDIYNGYVKYGFDNPSKALNQELQKIYNLVIQGEKTELE